MLLDRDQSTLLVVDIQEKLAPHIEGAESVVANAARLIDGAVRLAVPVLATEQYPAGLGRIVPALSVRIPPGNIVEKNRFAAAREPEFRRRLGDLGGRRRQFVVPRCSRPLLMETPDRAQTDRPRAALSGQLQDQGTNFD